MRLATNHRMTAPRPLVAALLLAGLAVFAAPRVGEPDRSEGRAISAVRTIVSGEMLLPPDLATLRKRDGYVVEFHPAPDAVTSFAVTAVPANAGTNRHRAFCADDRRVIYVSDAVTPPRVERGRCTDTDRTLGP